MSHRRVGFFSSATIATLPLGFPDACSAPWYSFVCFIENEANPESWIGRPSSRPMALQMASLQRSVAVLVVDPLQVGRSTFIFPSNLYSIEPDPFSSSRTQFCLRPLHHSDIPSAHVWIYNEKHHSGTYRARDKRNFDGFDSDDLASKIWHTLSDYSIQVKVKVVAVDQSIMVLSQQCWLKKQSSR